MVVKTAGLPHYSFGIGSRNRRATFTRSEQPTEKFSPTTAPF
jgi:hypothetical protein